MERMSDRPKRERKIRKNKKATPIRCGSVRVVGSPLTDDHGLAGTEDQLVNVLRPYAVLQHEKQHLLFLFCSYYKVKSKKTQQGNCIMYTNQEE
jgi:hypothetical protein